MKGKQQQGVALVITLILLTIITVIAVAFLAVTHRERASVTETLNSTDSEFAMTAALERAKAEIMGPILNRTNFFNTELRVSTTFPSFLSTNPPPGVDLGRGPAVDTSNVNFDYDNLGNDFFNYTTPQWRTLYERIGQNLFYDPRAPVFVNTNRGGKTGPLDYRFYLDLNRNGRFEDTRIFPVIDSNGQPVDDPDNPGRKLQDLFIGDPHWVGIPQFPNLFHSHTNRFIARYAYMILPAGKSLDLNYIANQARTNLSIRLTPNTIQSGYLRNQGVGSWELNLGAFFTDLNTNIWTGYAYRPTDFINGNQGGGFYDAAALLHYRYRRDQEAPLASPSPDKNLPTAAAMFPNVTNLQQIFSGDLIDAYVNSAYSAMNFGAVLPPGSDVDNTTTNWVGGEGKQHFFRPDDMFDRPSFDFPEFRYRMTNASAQTSFYDRYTFYRMLTQLGTDSAPEKDMEIVAGADGRPVQIINKININFANAPDAYGNQYFSTNLIEWQPVDFFSNTVNVLLREELPQYLTNGALNIPVFTNGFSHFTNGEIILPVFTPRARQILQVAANIYEATRTNRPINLPCVYRPIYEVRNNNDIYITRFVEERSSRNILSANWVDLDIAAERSTLANVPSNLVYNIGVIIGARKGLPNFNEYKDMSIVQVSRKLEFPKHLPTDLRPYATNQQFNITITNSCGIETWNSYTQAYPRVLNVRTVYTNGLALTNSSGLFYPLYTGRGTNLAVTNWPGRVFVVPPGSNEVVLAPSSYLTRPSPHFVPVQTNANFDSDLRSYTNAWGLEVTNRFRCIITDDTVDGIVDVVGISARNHFNISAELDRPIDDTGNYAANVWSKQKDGPNGVCSVGIKNQIQASAFGAPLTYWAEYADRSYNPSMVQKFSDYIGNSGKTTGTETNMAAPFVPVRTMIKTNSLQVNDPLVHYTREDLLDAYPYDTNGVATISSADTNSMALYLGRGIHASYQPWGTMGSNTVDYVEPPDPEAPNVGHFYDERLKDAMIRSSDDWQFPAQKFPSVGWLARVHRGTPWQTINFKGFSQEGNSQEWRRQARLAYMPETHPTNDWRLVELFTTAIHPNATRGQLSINQTNLAAWSAVLSGIGVTTLSEDKDKNPLRTNALVEPFANGSPIQIIVNAIGRRRASTPMKQFFRLSEFVSTPELTSQSPYLLPPVIPQSATPAIIKKTMLTDLDYERIPDEILSLVKVGDVRFVVYAYGQSLKPAPNLPDYPSIVTTGPYAGMCINYQITGETAARAVIRVDFDRVMDPVSPYYLKPDYRRPHAVVESFNVLTP